MVGSLGVVELALAAVSALLTWRGERGEGGRGLWTQQGSKEHLWTAAEPQGCILIPLRVAAPECLGLKRLRLKRLKLE